MRYQWSGALFVIISALGFATLSIFGKLVMQTGMPKETALAYRFVLAVPFIFLWSWLGNARSHANLQLKGVQEPTKNIAKKLNAFALGFIGIGVMSTLFFESVTRLGAGITNIIFYLYPSISALIDRFLFGRTLTLRSWVAIAISWFGLILVSDVFHIQDMDGLGVLIAVGMAFWYSVYLVGAFKITHAMRPIAASSWVCFGAAVFFVIYSLLNETLVLATPDQMTWLWALAMISTVIPFGFLYMGIAKLGVFHSAFLSAFEVLFALAMAILFLGESFSLIQAVGCTMVIISVLLLSWKPRVKA